MRQPPGTAPRVPPPRPASSRSASTAGARASRAPPRSRGDPPRRRGARGGSPARPRPRPPRSGRRACDRSRGGAGRWIEPRGGVYELALPELADARLLPHSLAQVVELGAPNVADRDDLELLDLGRVEGERALDADAERLLPHRERLAEPGALALEADALEDLDPLPVALDDLEVDAQRVPCLELRQVRAHVALLEALDNRVHRKGTGPEGRSMLAKANSLRRPVRHEDGPDEVRLGHRAPDPRVTRLRAVVSHHEVVVLRHAERLLGTDVPPVVLDVRLLQALPVDVDERGAATKPDSDPLPR